jgi:hypothetical protein
MKQLISALAVALIFAFTSCGKHLDTVNQDEHVKDQYRVLGIGKAAGDTSISTVMFARTETVGLVVAEDSKLKAELIGYQKINGHGVYTVAMTNKQPCQVIMRWGWENLTIDSISPGGAQGDVIPANGYKVFTLIGDAKVGKIKVQAQGVDCGNSSTLIVNITVTILPIKYISNTASYDTKTGKVTITFEADRPDTINWFLIMKLINQKWQQVAMIPAEDNTKKYSIKL